MFATIKAFGFVYPTPIFKNSRFTLHRKLDVDFFVVWVLFALEGAASEPFCVSITSILSAARIFLFVNAKTS